MKRLAILDRHRLALFACLVLAATLRFVNLGEAVTWEDEAVAFNTVQSGSSFDIIRVMVATDATRAPLHPLILHGWLSLFGTSLVIGRALSAVCGLIAVGLVYVLGRQAFDKPTALLACGLAAVNPLDVHHSREIRMYECVVLVTCLCWTLLFSFRRSAGLGKQVAYALALTALVYLHPLGGLMVIALALGYLALRPDLKLGWKAWFAIHVALTAMLAPWVYRYLDHGPQEFPRTLTARLLLEWPEGFTGGNAEAAWAGAALIIGGIIASRRKNQPNDRVSSRPVRPDLGDVARLVPGSTRVAPGLQHGPASDLRRASLFPLCRTGLLAPGSPRARRPALAAEGRGLAGLPVL